LHVEKNLWPRSASSMHRGEDEGHCAASGHANTVLEHKTTELHRRAATEFRTLGRDDGVPAWSVVVGALTVS
jgi:hypothetical protein